MTRLCWDLDSYVRLVLGGQGDGLGSGQAGRSERQDCLFTVNVFAPVMSVTFIAYVEIARNPSCKAGLTSVPHRYWLCQAGGNAIDAAVAAALCLGVLNPMASGLGGGNFMVIRLANKTAIVLDSREQAPLAAYEVRGLGPSALRALRATISFKHELLLMSNALLPSTNCFSSRLGGMSNTLSVYMTALSIP